MARPKKDRVICSTPRYRHFYPAELFQDEEILLEFDEYEVLRLHDLEHLTQSEVAKQMLISRPTVTLLLNTAHQKVADALVNGKPIAIGGGSCNVCEIGKCCPKAADGTCHKKQRCAASCRYKKQSDPSIENH